MAKSHWAGSKQKPILYPLSGGKGGDRVVGVKLVLPATKLPKRRWIYGRDLIRGFVTVVAAPGGTGKSILVMAMLLGIAIGRNLLGGKQRLQKCNVMILSLEDPHEEFVRRTLGIMKRFAITAQELDGHVFVHPEGQDLRMGSLGEDDEGNEVVVFPDREALVAYARANKVGVICADPFSETHQLRESDNPDMVEVMKGWRDVARAADCAVLLVHHERKGGGVATEAVRGAKAITDSARVVLRVSQMGDEGKDWGIAEDDRWQYVRLDNGKANLAPKHRVRWFHITGEDIGNGDDGGPGDTVPVPAFWPPPTFWSKWSVEQLNAVLDRIAAGTPDGTLYSEHKNSKDRWAGWLLVAELKVDEAGARKMLKTWVTSGTLREDTYTNKEGHTVKGLVVENAKRPGWVA